MLSILIPTDYFKLWTVIVLYFGITPDMPTLKVFMNRAKSLWKCACDRCQMYELYSCGFQDVPCMLHQDLDQFQLSG